MWHNAITTDHCISRSLRIAKHSRVSGTGMHALSLSIVLLTLRFSSTGQGRFLELFLCTPSWTKNTKCMMYTSCTKMCSSGSIEICTFASFDIYSSSVPWRRDLIWVSRRLISLLKTTLLKSLINCFCSTNFGSSSSVSIDSYVSLFYSSN